METNTISALPAKSLPKFTISIPKSPIKSFADYGILDYMIWNEAGLTDFRLFILMQEGGMA